MRRWYEMSDGSKEIGYRVVADKLGLPINAVEKDWWVVQTLKLTFETEIGSHLVFKGGTSLSKSWGVINRFSEDIDLAANRAFFGFDGELNGSQRTKLRKASADYLIKKFKPELEKKFNEQGMNDVKIHIEPTKESDQDPKIIEIHYPSVTPKNDYIRPRVLLEIGCRSLIEPFTQRNVISLLDEHIGEGPFTFVQEAISIPSVNTERTFLEKIFLLHEEFQKPQIKGERKSRHLYDLYKLLELENCKKSILNKQLYQTIVAHRQRYTKISGVDYDKHQPAFIRFLPTEQLMEEYRKDYNTMLEQMIHEENPVSFDQIIKRLTSFNEELNRVVWK
jgi:predicted nucleotidyltransferase component of viral defense system